MATPVYPKRPGSPMAEHALPSPKNPRLGSGQLQINYLVRQKSETLPLVTVDERMSRILQLIGEYDGVLQRHESMAGNLGACPLGPILLKRFERLFEGPPKVLKSHAKDPSVTWLDVVEFAAHRPEQFNLEKQRNGVRVCQFYHKQCRVEISEEDYVLIASGMPQKLIPPQPILEDEEKELGVMEILERNMGKVVQMADQVSARARQLNHKIKNRRAAILTRRENEPEPQQFGSQKASPDTPPPIGRTLGLTARSLDPSQSPPQGFTAVNNKQTSHVESEWRIAESLRDIATSAASSVAGVNGEIRPDSITKFLTESEKQAGMTEDTVRRSSLPQLGRDTSRLPASRTRQDATTTFPNRSDKAASSVAIPGTPASLLPQAKPATLPKDDGGPYKTEMVARMENMARGERVIPPCDRCRRLQMDCMKNLTACQGCTKKHAKCSWKEVTFDELKGAATILVQSQGEETLEPAVKEWDHLLQDKDRDADKGGQQSSSDTIEVASSTRPSHVTSPTSTPIARANTTESSSRLDLKPPPLDQQIRDANGKYSQQPGQLSTSRSTAGAASDRPKSADAAVIDDDEGDRLQELARRVYRSASQSVRPPE